MKYKLPVRTQRAILKIKSGRAACLQRPNTAVLYASQRDLFLKSISEHKDSVPVPVPNDWTNDRPGKLPVHQNTGNVFSESLVDMSSEDYEGISHVTCSCGTSADLIESEGQYVCTSCGLVSGNIYDMVATWHGTHVITKKQVYDYNKHMERHLKPLFGKIEHVYIRKVQAVFPVAYKAFFKIAPNRKNFMSYGFVIRKLLQMMCCDVRKLNIPTVKTPSKVRDCERYWSGMLEIMDLTGL